MLKADDGDDYVLVQHTRRPAYTTSDTNQTQIFHEPHENDALTSPSDGFPHKYVSRCPFGTSPPPKKKDEPATRGPGSTEESRPS